jgi:hypothetical protein
MNIDVLWSSPASGSQIMVLWQSRVIEAEGKSSFYLKT